MLLIQILIPLNVYAFENKNNKHEYKYVKRKYKESVYQNAWCSANSGVTEFENKDFTRVDCLTDTHAVEFDFANKWAEGIGQALHYQKMTNKTGKVF